MKILNATRTVPYILLNKSVLHNCEIEAENHFLGLQQHVQNHCLFNNVFTVNLAFVNYFANVTKSLDSLILLNRTMYEKITYFLGRLYSRTISPKTLKE